MSEKRQGLGRSVGAALVLAAIAVGAGRFGYGKLFGDPEAPKLPPVKAEPIATTQPDAGTTQPTKPAVEAKVLAIEGSAERGTGDTWTPLQPGDVLRDDEMLRTAAGARVELQVGAEDARLTVPDLSTIQVAELTEALHRFRLSRGRVAVDYGASETRKLRIEGGRNGHAVAETRGARFTVLSTGTTVAVAAEAGSVDLTAGGTTVAVTAGQQSIASEGTAPSLAQPIPADVLLKVARGAARAETCAEIKGTVRPGSEVRVGETLVDVTAEGAFQVAVPKVDGLEKVQLRVLEPGGKERTQLVACRITAREPDAKVEFDWK